MTKTAKLTKLPPKYKFLEWMDEHLDEPVFTSSLLSTSCPVARFAEAETGVPLSIGVTRYCTRDSSSEGDEGEIGLLGRRLPDWARTAVRTADSLYSNKSATIADLRAQLRKERRFRR